MKKIFFIMAICFVLIAKSTHLRLFNSIHKTSRALNYLKKDAKKLAEYYRQRVMR